MTGHSQGTNDTFLTLPQVSGVGGHSLCEKIDLMNRHLLCLTLSNHANHCFQQYVNNSKMINAQRDNTTFLEKGIEHLVSK